MCAGRRHRSKAAPFLQLDHSPNSTAAKLNFKKPNSFQRELCNFHIIIHLSKVQRRACICSFEQLKKKRNADVPYRFKWIFSDSWNLYLNAENVCTGRITSFFSFPLPFMHRIGCRWYLHRAWSWSHQRKWESCYWCFCCKPWSKKEKVVWSIIRPSHNTAQKKGNRKNCHGSNSRAVAG